MDDADASYLLLSLTFADQIGAGLTPSDAALDEQAALSADSRPAARQRSPKVSLALLVVLQRASAVVPAIMSASTPVHWAACSCNAGLTPQKLQ